MAGTRFDSSGGFQYVLADIHGQTELFQSIMEQIQLREEDTLYVLGDVIDRHPGGPAILNHLISMPNVRMVLGNHEYMMLNALDPFRFTGNPEVEVETIIRNVENWYANGGQITHRSLRHMPQYVQESLFAYLRNLPLSYRIEVNGQLFELVHAAPPSLFERHRGRYDSVLHFSVWYRWKAEEAVDDSNATVVFGHTPTILLGQKTDPLTIYYGDHRIGIDCGAAYADDSEMYGFPRGRLACLRLNDMKEFYSD